MAAFEKRKGHGQSLNHINADFIDTSYQKWISRQMDARVLEYSDTSKVTICCGTWNVNARQLPEPYDLSTWLSLRGAPYADIYVISLQEMVDLNMINVVLVTSTSDDMSIFWIQKILDTLNNMTGGDNYKFIAERHFVGLMGMVFAKKSLAAHITDVRSTVVYTGGFGTTGNKGGIAIRMDVRDSGLCFVASHFHANRGNIEQRNQDFQTIYESASFPPQSERLSGKRQSKAGTTLSTSGGQHHTISHPALPSGIRPNSLNFAHAKAHLTLDIACHEQIFWLGDLNYRIGGDLDDASVLELVERNEWPSLLELDQLSQQREMSNVFTGFEEGKIVFPPSYKFQPGTELYEHRPDKKLRAPAWCDRILWKSNLSVKHSTKLMAYQSIGALKISDHRPVHAWFETTIRQIVPDRMRHLYQELLFNVDKWINASTPKLEINNRVFELGEITMETRHRVTIEIHNNGTVMTEWAFVPKNDDTIVAPPWLKFSPADGILAPGERMTITATIFLSVELLGTCFPTYTSGPLRLDEIVILRVRKGSDIFCIFTSVIPEDNIVETKAKAAQMALSIQHASIHYGASPMVGVLVPQEHSSAGSSASTSRKNSSDAIVASSATTATAAAINNSNRNSSRSSGGRSPIPSMPRSHTTTAPSSTTGHLSAGRSSSPIPPSNLNIVNPIKTAATARRKLPAVPSKAASTTTITTAAAAAATAAVVERDEDETDDEDANVPTKGGHGGGEDDIDLVDIYGRPSTV